VVQDPRFYELGKEGEEIELDLAGGLLRVAGEEFRAEEPSAIIQALVGKAASCPPSSTTAPACSRSSRRRLDLDAGRDQEARHHV